MLLRRRWLALAAGVCVLPAAAARHEQERLFGSPVDLLVDPGTPRSANAAVWQGLRSFNTRFNAWKPGELLEANAAFRAGRSLRVSPALQALLQGAAQMEQLSGGCFNAGIGTLVSQWGFHDDLMRPGVRPPAASVQRLAALQPSLRNLRWQGRVLRSEQAALQLDLGGYAKGAALDWALDLLQREGAQGALLNLGGNLAVLGQHGGKPWQVGIRDPWGPGLTARLAVQGREAVVTSGSYERFRVLDGQRVTHILDPRSGQPAPDLVSVTVVHPQAALADAAATALLVAGAERWPLVAAGMGVDQVLVVHRDGRQQATPALRARLS